MTPSTPERSTRGGQRGPVRELRAFVEAALIDPVPRDRPESRAVVVRRRIVCAVTLLVGGIVLGWALRIPAGDGLFYVGTLALAAVWAVGGFASGTLHLGRAHTRCGRDDARPVVQSLALGGLLLGLFLLGALVVAHIPLLRGPVDELLDHARFGSLPLVAAITAINGAAEEVFFRGGLYAAAGRRHGVAVTTAAYTIVTAASGIPLLVLAGLLLGLVTGLQRRVTGGILGPIITHLTWSMGMLFILPKLLEALG